MLVLFETSAGYAIFKLVDEKKLSEVDNLYKDFETAEKASEVVKLKMFKKFEDTTEALAAATASIEAKMSKSLKKLLKKVASSEMHEELAVADAKVGNLIQEKFDITCVCSTAVNELMRGIRTQMDNLITEVPKKKKKKKTKVEEVEVEKVEEVKQEDEEVFQEKPKKKKKKKKSLETTEEQEEGISETVTDEVTEEQPKKKKKKKKKKSSETAEEEISERVPEEVMEESPKKKRKKDKKKVEEASAPTNEAEASPEGTAPYTGQWGTASLGSEARSEKFLRLMGGFKASNLTKTDSSKKFASTALSGKREETLYKGLAAQYDQAFETTKQKRGLGLGYEPIDDTDGKPSFSFPT